MNIDDVEPENYYCPYCQNILKKKPLRKTKCKSCGNYIYSKYSPGEKKEEAKPVTKDQADEIEKLWDAAYARSKFIEKLKRFSISEKEFSTILESNVGYQDAEALTFIQLIKSFLDSQNSFHLKKCASLELSQELAKLKQPFFESLKAARRFELLEIRQTMQSIENSERVKINVSKNCSDECVCKKLKGKIYNIETALLEMPIPCEDCDEWLGICRCWYSPVFDPSL